MEMLLSLLKTIPEYGALLDCVSHGESVAVTGIENTPLSVKFLKLLNCNDFCYRAILSTFDVRIAVRYVPGYR